MKPLDVAARLLRAVPHDFYCQPCLAAAVHVSLTTVAEISAILTARSDYVSRDAVCVGCGRTQSALAYAPLKCVRCSRLIEPDELIRSRGDHFHEHCWQVLESAARIADSRQMARLSRELIRRSLERLRLRPGPD
jgi:hypothetical protein